MLILTIKHPPLPPPNNPPYAALEEVPPSLRAIVGPYSIPLAHPLPFLSAREPELEIEPLVTERTSLLPAEESEEHGAQAGKSAVKGVRWRRPF